MVRFLRDIGLLALVLAAVGGGLLYGALERIDDQDYLAATHDKHRLMETAPSPRLIFVGGSSVAFGLDGRVLRDPPQKLLPGYVPINMGLHVELGLEFMLNEALDGVRTGDVVVIALEYDPFLRHQGSTQVLKILEHRPASFAYVNPLRASEMSLQYFGQVTRRGVKFYQGKRGQTEELPYVRRGFNAYGDLVMHHGRTPADFGRGFSEHTFGRSESSEQYLSAAVALLNDFDAACRVRGGQVVLVCPPYAADLLTEGSPRRQAADWVNAELRKRLTFPVLDTPIEAAQPREQFFDTPYHLGGVGAVARTRRLAGLIKAHLASQP